MRLRIPRILHWRYKIIRTHTREFHILVFDFYEQMHFIYLKNLLCRYYSFDYISDLSLSGSILNIQILNFSLGS